MTGTKEKLVLKPTFQQKVNTSAQMNGECVCVMSCGLLMLSEVLKESLFSSTKALRTPNGELSVVSIP